ARIDQMHLPRACVRVLALLQWILKPVGNPRESADHDICSVIAIDVGRLCVLLVARTAVVRRNQKWRPVRRLIQLEPLSCGSCTEARSAVAGKIPYDF